MTAPLSDNPSLPATRPAGRLDNRVIGMMLLVALEIMLFTGMLGGYIALRHAAAVWPPPLAPPLNVRSGGLATLIIVLSNLALALAGWWVRRSSQNGPAELPAHRVQRRRIHFAIVTALFLGLLFSILQALEWRQFIYDPQGLLGYGVSTEPAPAGGFFTLLLWHMGRSTYGAFFFMLTITHALHLWVGMLILAWLLFKERLWSQVGTLGTRLEITAWFWHFVGVAWIFLYYVLYLKR